MKKKELKQKILDLELENKMLKNQIEFWMKVARENKNTTYIPLVKGYPWDTTPYEPPTYPYSPYYNPYYPLITCCVTE